MGKRLLFAIPKRRAPPCQGSGHMGKHQGPLEAEGFEEVQGRRLLWF